MKSSIILILFSVFTLTEVNAKSFSENERDIKISPQKRIEFLTMKVNNYKSLSDSLQAKSDSLQAQLKKTDSLLTRINSLMTDNSSIFNEKDVFDKSEYPLCLTKHIEIINHFIEARKICEVIDSKIQDAHLINSKLRVDINKVIKDNILNDFIALDEKLTLIEELDLSSLSENQQAYLKETLNSKYNSYITYINNETE